MVLQHLQWDYEKETVIKTLFPKKNGRFMYFHLTDWAILITL